MSAARSIGVNEQAQEIRRWSDWLPSENTRGDDLKGTPDTDHTSISGVR